MKIKLFILIALVHISGLFGGLNAQITRISNPVIKGNLTFSNGYYIRDTVGGIKMDYLVVTNTIKVGSSLIKDSSDFIVFSKIPKFPVSSPTKWINNSYISDVNGSKIQDTSITIAKLSPSLYSAIFSETSTFKGLEALYTGLNANFLIEHDYTGYFKTNLFGSVIGHNRGLTSSDPGTLYIKVGTTMDTTGGLLNVKQNLDGGKITNGTINSQKLADTSVSNSKIKINSLTADKFNSTKIKGARISNDTMYVIQRSYILWNPGSISPGDYVEKSDGTPDTLGYVFPRKGKITAFSLANSSGSKVQNTSLDVSFDALEPIQLFYNMSNQIEIKVNSDTKTTINQSLSSANAILLEITIDP